MACGTGAFPGKQRAATARIAKDLGLGYAGSGLLNAYIFIGTP